MDALEAVPYVLAVDRDHKGGPNGVRDILFSNWKLSSGLMVKADMPVHMRASAGIISRDRNFLTLSIAPLVPWQEFARASSSASRP